MKYPPLLNLVLSVLLVLLIGIILYVGRPILLPVVTATIAVYVITSTSRRLRQLPGLDALPDVVIRTLLLLIFAAAVIVFAFIVAATVREISSVIPNYEANLQSLLEGIALRFDLDEQDIWDELRAITIGRIDLSAMFLTVLGGFTNVGGTVFLIVIYTAFMISERDGFARKISAAVRGPVQAEKTMNIVSDIDRQISDYLAVKTLINIILGTVSYVILWTYGVDFALFWAIFIGLLNYIPYVGSLLGVMFPVALSLAQFASVPTTLGLTVLLVTAQTIVGNFLEPRMIGRQLNLSPFVVLIALSVWTALWGIPGAILAVPMTSIVAIILANFESTRPFAILLAERIEEDGKGTVTTR